VIYPTIRTFKFSPRAIAKSTLNASFEQASKHSTTTRLKLGISAVGQRCAVDNKQQKIQKHIGPKIGVTKTQKPSRQKPPKQTIRYEMKF